MPTSYRVLLATVLLLLTMPLAGAQKSHKMHPKTKMWYLDTKQKEFYTPAEAKRGKFHNEVGDKLVRATYIPNGFKRTDDFNKVVAQRIASTSQR